MKIQYGGSSAASFQRKEYGQTPAFSNKTTGSSYSSFNSSVNSAHSVVQSARNLKTKTSNQPVDIYKNYYLTDSEKLLLISKATEFAEPGIVPYDVLEDFLYVLCYVDDYDTMKFVAKVTGVEGLDNPSIIRIPVLILNVLNLSKIGYLANGLASLTKQIDHAKYTQASSAQDTESSAYSTLFKAASSLSSAGQTVSAFPGVEQFSSILSTITSVTGAIQGLTSTFSAPGNTATKIGQLSSVLTQVSSLTQNMQSVLNVAGQQNVTSLFPMMNQINNLVQNTNRLTKSVETLKNVVSSNSYPNNKVAGINAKLDSIFNSVNGLVSQFSSITSLVSNIGSPGNVGLPASVLLKVGGAFATSPAITEKTLGQKIPTNILANNPLMTAVSGVGKLLFGEALIPVITVDQDFKRPIGSYKSPSSGAATASFKMQNFASMGGSISPQQFVSSVVYGVAAPAVGSALSTIVSGQTTQILSVLGAAATSMVEPRRSDNAIPMMIAIAKTLSNDSGSPFPTSVYSAGWRMASSVANDLQKSNSEFLKQIQTTA